MSLLVHHQFLNIAVFSLTFLTTEFYFLEVLFVTHCLTNWFFHFCCELALET